jgi:hypothetical protein
MIKQYDILKINDKSRNTGYHKRIKIKFGDTNLKDFVMMMYLDMYHDNLVTGTLTEFVNSGIPSELLGVTNLKKIIGDTDIKTELIKENIFNSKTDKPMSKYEEKFKKALAPIFGLKEPYIFNQSVNLSGYAKDKRNPVYLSIDAESKKTAFSSLIAQSKYSNGRVHRKFVKSIISIPNRIDPGSLMPVGGGVQEYNKLFNIGSNSSIRSTQLYDFCDYTINFHNKTITLKSHLEEQTQPFYLYIDDVEYPIGASKGKAETGSSALKISKFLGDFLQIIVTVKSNKTFVATQDGMCSAMTAFMGLNFSESKTPRLFLDYAQPQGNKVVIYGAEDLLKKDPSQNHELTNILTGQNNNNNNSNNEVIQPIKNTLILQEKNKFIRAIRKLTSLNKTKQNMYISSYNRGLNSENLLKRAKNDNNITKEIAQVRRAKTLRPKI